MSKLLKKNVKDCWNRQNCRKLLKVFEIVNISKVIKLSILLKKVSKSRVTFWYPMDDHMFQNQKCAHSLSQWGTRGYLLSCPQTLVWTEKQRCLGSQIVGSLCLWQCFVIYWSFKYLREKKQSKQSKRVKHWKCGKRGKSGKS